MGYSISIGEAFIDGYDDNISIGAELQHHPEAPDSDSCGNDRSPSYTVWGNAMEALGLRELMYGDGDSAFVYLGECFNPLIRNDGGGVTRIVLAHVVCAELAVRAYKAMHPTHVGSYGKLKPGIEDTGLHRGSDYIDDPTLDGNLLRGEWLAYWLRWAYENCKHPVFVHS